MTNARSINVRRLRMVAQPKHSVRGFAGLVLVLVSVTVPVRAPRAQDSTAVGKDIHRAQVLTELGRFDQAVEVLRKVIAADSHNVVAFERIGATYALHGQIPEAIAAWRRALELNPHLASAHTNLGNAFADMGEHDSAIAEHRVVIALDSTKSIGYVDLGSALESMGRDEDAITQYQRAIELDPRDALAWYNLAVSFYHLKRWSEAYAAAQESWDWDSFSSEPSELMASMSALASNDLAAQAKERPDDAMVHFANAHAHEFRGDRGTAKKEIDRALEIDPSNQIFYHTKAAFTWTRGKPKDAIRVLQACVAAVPSSWLCYAALGDDYGRVGDKQQALDALTAAERLAPADAAVQFELGLAYAALGQDQQAAAALEKTLALGASHANVHYNLAVVYARLANYDAAWLHARIAEHQGYPAADLISRLAQLAPEPIW